VPEVPLGSSPASTWTRTWALRSAPARLAAQLCERRSHRFPVVVRRFVSFRVVTRARARQCEGSATRARRSSAPPTAPTGGMHAQ
jgi:hypothetical protein